MINFDHIFNWKLLSGSHDFPGPEGGTCINEAAIVAAGFKYKKVGSAADCPPCFSRLIASFAIYLNDNMPDDLRQKLLMPFVTRLAGTADTPEIERQRAEFIIIGLLRDVVSIPLRGWKDDLANKFGAVTSLEEGQKACEALAHALALARDIALALARDLAHARDIARDLARDIARDLALALDLAHALDIALTLARALARDLARDLALALALALDLALARDLDLKIFEAATRLLDGALKIGKQAEPVEMALVETRMESIKQLVKA